MEKHTMNFNSVVNQRIKEKFVQREVKACFSYEMDAILQAEVKNINKNSLSLPSLDVIENLYEDVCTSCGESRPYNDANGGEMCLCGHEYESQPQEIFEWWIVSEYLYKALKGKHEPVLEWGNNYYWGRGTCGQSIMLDNIISVICSDMGILDGQKYTWKERI